MTFLAFIDSFKTYTLTKLWYRCRQFHFDNFKVLHYFYGTFVINVSKAFKTCPLYNYNIYSDKYIFPKIWENIKGKYFMFQVYYS